MKKVNVYAKSSKNFIFGSVPVEDQLKYVDINAFVKCPYCEKEIKVLCGDLRYSKRIVMKCVEDEFEVVIPSQIFIEPGALISRETFFDSIEDGERRGFLR